MGAGRIRAWGASSFDSSRSRASTARNILAVPWFGAHAGPADGVPREHADTSFAQAEETTCAGPPQCLRDEFDAFLEPGNSTACQASLRTTTRDDDLDNWRFGYRPDAAIFG